MSASLRVVAAGSIFTLAGLTAREFATTVLIESAPLAAPLLIPIGAALVERVGSIASLPNCPWNFVVGDSAALSPWWCLVWLVQRCRCRAYRRRRQEGRQQGEAYEPDPCEERSGHLTLRPKLGSLLAGDFVLVRAGGEEVVWNEVWLGARVPDTQDWICKTTNVDGSDFIWSYLRFSVGLFRLALGRDAARAAPLGVPADSVNWICIPPAAAVKWTMPPEGERQYLQAEAEAIASLVPPEGAPAAYIVRAGVSTAVIEYAPPPVAMAGAPPGRDAPVLAVAAAGAAGAAEATGGVEEPLDATDLAMLRESILEIQSGLLQADGRSPSCEKKGEDRSDRKKKKGRSRSSSRGRKRREKVVELELTPEPRTEYGPEGLFGLS